MSVPIGFPQQHVPFLDARTGLVSRAWYSFLRAVINRLGASAHAGIPGFTGSGAPSDGVSGTGVGVAEKGWLYIDMTNARAYINNGSITSPTWKRLAREA